MATTARPKESKGVLEPTSNTFAIQAGMLYDYYTIRFGRKIGPYVEIQKLPPVISEGYVTYQKKLFRVTLKDYFRSRVNVEQPAYTIPTSNTNDGNGSSVPEHSASSVVAASVDLKQPRTESDAGFQVDKAVDLAWEDQIRALLYVEDPEAEWEF